MYRREKGQEPWPASAVWPLPRLRDPPNSLCLYPRGCLGLQSWLLVITVPICLAFRRNGPFSDSMAVSAEWRCKGNSGFTILES